MKLTFYPKSNKVTVSYSNKVKLRLPIKFISYLISE